MANRETRKATVIATGKIIEVYQHATRSTWIDASNTSDEYKESELRF